MTDRNYPLPSYTPPPAWSTASILPAGFLPMLPTAARLALDSENYGFEVRWEGLRVLMGLEGKHLLARTSAGQDPSPWFPELASLRAAAAPEWVLIDGELIVEEEGRPSADALRRRLLAPDSASAARLAAAAPACLIAYDLLRIGDSWLLDVAWEERREILSRAVAPTRGVRRSPVSRDGHAALAHACNLGLEAVIAKRPRGRYVPGGRTRDWLSVKPPQELDALVCGWTTGRGARSIGALLLGLYDAGTLVFVGQASPGTDPELLARLENALRPAGRPPFAAPPGLSGAVNWALPDVVCRVRHIGWSENGRLRGAALTALPALPAGAEQTTLILRR